MGRAALTNAASVRHGRRTARTVWHSMPRAEGPMRHVWRIGQPLQLVSHSRKEGARREVPQHVQERLAARTVNERDGDRRMLRQLPGSLHSTRYIIRSLGVCIVTTRLRIITTQTARSSEATEERRYVRCARPCACVQSCSGCTVAWHRRQRAPPLYLESLKH